MPLFLCRWPNSECSVVLARTEDDAIVQLDQVGNAEDCPITQVRTFQLQFALTDRGELTLERFGEGTKSAIETLSGAGAREARAIERGGGRRVLRERAASRSRR